MQAVNTKHAKAKAQGYVNKSSLLKYHRQW